LDSLKAELFQTLIKRFKKAPRAEYILKSAIYYCGFPSSWIYIMNQTAGTVSI
jgi:hypothetical protein